MFKVRDCGGAVRVLSLTLSRLRLQTYWCISRHTPIRLTCPGDRWPFSGDRRWRRWSRHSHTGSAEKKPHQGKSGYTSHSTRCLSGPQHRWWSLGTWHRGRFLTTQRREKDESGEEETAVISFRQSWIKTIWDPWHNWDPVATIQILKSMSEETNK